MGEEANEVRDMEVERMSIVEVREGEGEGVKGN